AQPLLTLHRAARLAPANASVVRRNQPARVIAHRGDAAPRETILDLAVIPSRQAADGISGHIPTGITRGDRARTRLPAHQTARINPPRHDGHGITFVDHTAVVPHQ